MATLKSFEAVLYSDKVECKGTFLRPLPPKGVPLKNKKQAFVYLDIFEDCVQVENNFKCKLTKSQ